MQDPSPVRYSKARRSLHWTLAACAALAFVGLVVGGSTGDETPPYDETLLNNVTWGLFLFSAQRRSCSA